ncbi:hypothetical protein ACFXOY_07945 [Streptomyces niveus]
MAPSVEFRQSTYQEFFDLCEAAQEHRAPFRDRDLPYRLDAEDTATTCAD